MSKKELLKVYEEAKLLPFISVDDLLLFSE